MKILKSLFPFIAALGIYLFTLNSPMQKQMNHKNLIDKEIKTIPVEGFKFNQEV